MAAFKAGDKLGPYEILAPIGAGGMGEVYKARDTRLDRDVAVKVSKEHFSERFEQEARAIAALSHPHICHLYDVGPNYLVMELLDGVPIKGPVPLEKAIEYARQILDALDAAHQKGITHRDLKPANILLTKQGIKLLDFGLAKRTGIKESDATVTQGLTSQGQIVGTLQYMSPEQLQSKVADPRSDLFSFGCVLYELLTGKRAFDGSSAASVIAGILERPAPSVAEIAPRSLDRILARCLAKDPEDRWQSARDLRSSLELATEPQAASAAARPKPLAWMIAGLAVVVAAVALWAPWRKSAAGQQPYMRFSVDLGRDAVHSNTSAPVISPDGTRLVFAVRSPKSARLLAIRGLDQENATPLAGTENASYPFFSPDSRWIGFFAAGKMKKVSVDGGAPVTICDAFGVRGASWGENGDIIFTPSLDAGVGLSRVSSAGGVPQKLTVPAQGEVSHRWPQILPSGDSVLFTSSAVAQDYENGSIQVLSLKSGKWKTVQRGGYLGRYLPTSSDTGHLVYIHEGTLLAVPFDLKRMETTGSAVPLVEEVATSPINGSGQVDFSRNGTLIYGSARSQDVVLASIDSNGRTQPLLPPGAYAYPKLSPDGKLVAFQLAGDIQVYDLEHNRSTRLTFTHRSEDSAWTPDGKHLLFNTSTGAGSFWLQWIRTDGASDAQTLLESKAEPVRFSFSPDGSRVAFSYSIATSPGATGDILIMPLDMTDPEHPRPGRPELFARRPGTSTGLSFSPDGKWIAYVSNESGRAEIYVRPFPAPTDGSAGGKWQISSDGGFVAPIWSRDGKELFFDSLDGHIMTATYRVSGATFNADKPRLWSNVPGLVFGSLDSQHLVGTVVPGATEVGTSVHLTVLLNFFDEVRRRVPVTK